MNTSCVWCSGTSASGTTGAESGNDKRFPRGPERKPQQGGRPAPKGRRFPFRCCPVCPSAAGDPGTDRPAAATASRSAVLSFPAFPALANRCRGPHRKNPITRFPHQASLARIAPVAIYGDGGLRDLAQEKSRLGESAQGGFRHHFGRSSASPPVPQGQTSATRGGGKAESAMRQIVAFCLFGGKANIRGEGLDPTCALLAQ